MRNTKSAFTLVELIVVITILAILGTIAFISLQGYSAEARNSKRIQDLSSISSSLNIKLTRGMSVLSAIANSDNAASTIALGGAATADQAAANKYDAGAVNYTALEMKASEFSDPFDDSYVIGATTLAGGPFELAASIEQDGGEVAKLSGNYNNRTTALTTATGTNNAVKTFTLTSLTDTGMFKVGDTVDFTTTQDQVISKISSDGMSITVVTGPLVAGDLLITLNADEDTSLITSDAVTTFLSDGGSDLPY